jgi:hypothetical protein
MDMKGYNSKMTPQEMWNVVNYLRSVGPRTPLRASSAFMDRPAHTNVLQAWLGALALIMISAAAADAGARVRRPRRLRHTPAHETFGSAVSDFFGIRPATQPFPFPHQTHVAKKIGCTDTATKA